MQQQSINFQLPKACNYLKSTIPIPSLITIIISSTYYRAPGQVLTRIRDSCKVFSVQRERLDVCRHLLCVKTECGMLQMLASESPRRSAVASFELRKLAKSAFYCMVSGSSLQQMQMMNTPFSDPQRSVRQSTLTNMEDSLLLILSICIGEQL